MPDFDQASYWSDRHIRYEGDPRSVGHLGLSVEENKAGEEGFKHAVSLAARLLGKSGSSVVDLGCGYGRISKSFTDAGYDYLGIDVSDVALKQGKERNPAAGFFQKDLAKWRPEKQYDVVCVLFVFVHFVDDDRWKHFLQNALDAVKVGGYLFLADWFPENRTVIQQHVVSRPFSQYVSAFEANQFKLNPKIRSEIISMTDDSSARMFHFAEKLGSKTP